MHHYRWQLVFNFLAIYSTVVNLNCTRSFLFDLKCTKIDGGWGSAPDPAGGAYSAPPDPLAVRGEGGGEGRGGEGRGGEGREGRGGEGRGGEGRGGEGRGGEGRGGRGKKGWNGYFHTGTSFSQFEP